MAKMPNLFIVGAARCGTTSLWRRLQSHPQVFMPEGLLQKEPAFFSSLKRSRFKQWDSYLALFADAGEGHLWVGDASTAYLTDPESARRIHEHNPEARIIIMLRHPVHRAYSLYNWMVQEGNEYARSFAEALKLEGGRMGREIPNPQEPEYYYNYLYFHSGLYSEQVKRYVDLFGANVLIIKFENYIGDFPGEWARICRFLDIAPVQAGAPGTGGGPCGNESRRVRSIVEQYVLKKLSKYYFSVGEVKGEAGNIIFPGGRLGDRKGMQGEALRLALADRARKELQALKTLRGVTFRDRSRVFRSLHRIFAQWDKGLPGPARTSKEERDIWLAMGKMDKPAAKIKERIYRDLLERYKPDIASLSALTGLDFSGWLQ